MNDQYECEQLIDYLVKEWNVTVQSGDHLKYLGFIIDRNRANRTLTLSMPDIVNKLIDKFSANEIKDYLSPAIDDILNTDPNSQPIDPKRFMSPLMTALYPARHYRYDILLPVTILACSMAKPTVQHMYHLKRIVGYTRRTRHFKLELGGLSEKQIFELWCDAAHAIHMDGKGQGTIIITLGGRVIGFRTFKLKHVTLSSTESEISATSEGVTYALWLEQLAIDLGLSQSRPIILHQDNTSAIYMNNTKLAAFKRSKHIHTRNMFVTEQIQSGLIKQQHTGTDVMISDLGTKIHGNARILKLCQLIHLG
jgi:hypothetical protein